MNDNNNKGKSAAIVAYLSIFGTIIAYFMNFDDRSEFAFFHIRQAVGLHATFYLILFFVSSFQNDMMSMAFYIFFIV